MKRLALFVRVGVVIQEHQGVIVREIAFVYKTKVRGEVIKEAFFFPDTGEEIVALFGEVSMRAIPTFEESKRKDTETGADIA